MHKNNKLNKKKYLKNHTITNTPSLPVNIQSSDINTQLLSQPTIHCIKE